jgi:T-complex protein 1 subunit beta
MSNGEIQVTNDGATILKSIHLDNAAAKVLVSILFIVYQHFLTLLESSFYALDCLFFPPDISKVQDDEIGDGTTSVTVLTAELLREAEKLISQRIHPQTIVDGYRLASHAAFKALEASALDNR